MNEQGNTQKTSASSESREHYRKAREEFRKSVGGMLPEGFKEHRRNARREMLLAWRSMIDHLIERVDERS